jgi:hypothetical protein
MILGWCTGTQWWHGQGGIRIRESGTAAHLFSGAQGLESATSGAMDGAGATGDTIGAIITRFTTTTGTTRAAPLFTTEVITIAVAAGAWPMAIPERRTDHSTETIARLEGMNLDVAPRVAQVETRLRATDHPGRLQQQIEEPRRGGLNQARSADMATAGRRGVKPRAARPAWAEEEDPMAVAEAEAGAGNLQLNPFMAVYEF